MRALYERAAAIGAAMALQAVAPAAADWPMCRGDLAHTGVVAEAGAPLALTGAPRLRWRFDTGGVVEPSRRLPMGCSNRALSRALFAIDAESGCELWRFRVGGLVRTLPTVVDGVVYVGAHTCVLYALQAVRGELVWRTDLGGAVFGSPAVAGARVHVGSRDGNFHALDRATGERRAVVAIGANVWTSPTVAGDSVYFGAHTGFIYALAAQ